MILRCLDFNRHTTSSVMEAGLRTASMARLQGRDSSKPDGMLSPLRNVIVAVVKHTAE